MTKKPTTVKELASMGGRARAEKYSKEQIQAWGKQGGRPQKLDNKALARLRRMLGSGEAQAECARDLGVSPRTIGRIVAGIKAHSREADSEDALPQ